MKRKKLNSSFKYKLKSSLISGVDKGWSGFVWMLKILVPISFLSVILEYSGLLYKLNYFLKPAMGVLSLPPMAALPLVIGLVTGIYGGIASMMMLSFTVEQMTLIAVFLLISHNLIQEGIIQGKSGLHPFVATVIRLAASVATVIAVAYFLGPGTGINPSDVSVASETLPLIAVIQKWLVAMAYLSVKIFLIIMALMILLAIMKGFDLINYIIKALNPFLRALGLNQRVGMLWLTAVAFGIAYGAAVIVEESKEENLSKEELEKLHVSIGINHSMIEDPILFLALGIGAFWLWVPRLIIAIIAVHLYGLWIKMRGKQQSA
ncbi:MAG: iron transporter [Pseudomonadota bacterium]